MNASSLMDVHRILKKAETNCNKLNTNRFLDGLFCDFFFDDLMCWPPTKAGLKVWQNCTNQYIKSSKSGLAQQECDQNGNWFKIPTSNRTWTNYTECGSMFIRNFDEEDVNGIYDRWLPLLKAISQFGYCLSVICLILSIFIFTQIKRLHCARNRLHTHLFISFIMRAVMYLIKDNFFVENDNWLCKLIFTIRFYFITSNYMFLLMEGFYLHNLMFLNIFSESGVLVYCIAGWILPLFSLIPWLILKVLHENVHCWAKKGFKYIWLLLDIPVGVSILINFLIFLRIIQILFVKLTVMYIEQRKTKYQKLLKSTLILIPLFGIPYTLSYMLIFYINYSQTLELIWLFFDQTIIAFHGLFASLIYCLLNSEVQVEIKRKYASFKDRNNKEFRRNRTISHTTQMALNDEYGELDTGNCNGKKTSLF